MISRNIPHEDCFEKTDLIHRLQEWLPHADTSAVMGNDTGGFGEAKLVALIGSSDSQTRKQYERELLNLWALERGEDAAQQLQQAQQLVRDKDGGEAVSRGHFEQAVATAERLAAQHADWAEPRAVAGDLKRAEVQGLLRAVRDQLAASEDKDRVLERAVPEVEAAVRSLAGAIELLEGALSLRANHFGAMGSLVKTYMQVGEVAQAKRVIGLLERLQPHKAGQLAELVRQVEQALVEQGGSGGGRGGGGGGGGGGVGGGDATWDSEAADDHDGDFDID